MFLKMLTRIGRAILSLFKSGHYAWRGVAYALNNERSMRIHLCILVLVFQFAWLYGLARWGYLILLLAHGLVIACEMTNTAIEVLVDLETRGFNTVAGIAKDVAAGAVLITVVALIGVGVILFSDVSLLAHAGMRLLERPGMMVSLSIQVILGILFIFHWGKRGRLRTIFLRKRQKK